MSTHLLPKNRNFIKTKFLASFSNSGFIKFIFFGNYFYGLCAVALSIEASVQQQFPLYSFYYFFTIFCLTVVYYTKAYITDKSGYPSDERNAWYMNNKILVAWSQTILGALALTFIFLYFYQHRHRIIDLTPAQYFLILIFPLASALYYGINSTLNLRNIGWLKPFIIGFSWAGVVTFYPILFYHIRFFPMETYNHPADPFAPFSVISALLFLKNFMFISVLCIMFDIKDYVSDSAQQLNTFVVSKGLRKTIFFIIIPLCLLGLGTFVIYGITRQFHPIKIALNVVPFAFLIAVAHSLRVRRSLLYYLVIVDGLMLLKAVCGIIAMTYF